MKHYIVVEICASASLILKHIITSDLEHSIKNVKNSLKSKSVEINNLHASSITVAGFKKRRGVVISLLKRNKTSKTVLQK